MESLAWDELDESADLLPRRADTTVALPPFDWDGEVVELPPKIVRAATPPYFLWDCGLVDMLPRADECDRVSRSRWQFTIGQLLGVYALLALVAWPVSRFAVFYRQEAVIAQFESNTRGLPCAMNATPAEPPWLWAHVEQITAVPCRYVKRVALYDATVHRIEQLNQFPWMTRLWVENVESDEVLRKISELSELESLEIVYPQAITNRGIRHLTRLSKLRSLIIKGLREIDPTPTVMATVDADGLRDVLTVLDLEGFFVDIDIPCENLRPLLQRGRLDRLGLNRVSSLPELLEILNTPTLRQFSIDKMDRQQSQWIEYCLPEAWYRPQGTRHNVLVHTDHSRTYGSRRPK